MSVSGRQHKLLPTQCVQADATHVCLSCNFSHWAARAHLGSAVQEDEAFVRIKLVSCDTLKSKVLSLKQDLKYWPTW